jgi:hypothetical protein
VTTLSLSLDGQHNVIRPSGHLVRDTRRPREQTYAVGGPWGESCVTFSADLLVTLDVSFGFFGVKARDNLRCTWRQGP